MTPYLDKSTEILYSKSNLDIGQRDDTFSVGTRSELVKEELHARVASACACQDYPKRMPAETRRPAMNSAAFMRRAPSA